MSRSIYPLYRGEPASLEPALFVFSQLRERSGVAEHTLKRWVEAKVLWPVHRFVGTGGLHRFPVEEVVIAAALAPFAAVAMTVPPLTGFGQSRLGVNVWTIPGSNCSDTSGGPSMMSMPSKFKKSGSQVAVTNVTTRTGNVSPPFMLRRVGAGICCCCCAKAGVPIAKAIARGEITFMLSPHN